MRTLPDLLSLQCFVTLSKHLNFKTAAYEMYLSTSAMSDRIKKLEKELDVDLFHRNTRSVQLTASGISLLPHAQQLLQQAWQWVELTQMKETQTIYHLKLGTRFELGLSWLVPAIPLLKEKVPHRNIDFYWGNDHDLLQKLKQGHLDAVVSSVRMNEANLRSIALHKEEYVLVCSDQYWQTHQNHMHAHNAGYLTLIDTESHLPLFRYFLDALQIDELWDFKSIELMGTIAAVHARILSHAGIAVLPKYFVHEDLTQKKLHQIHSDIKLPHDFFRLIWRADHVLLSALQTLSDNLKSIDLT